jgi:hypothetical protein
VLRGGGGGVEQEFEELGISLVGSAFLPPLAPPVPAALDGKGSRGGGDGLLRGRPHARGLPRQGLEEPAGRAGRPRKRLRGAGGELRDGLVREGAGRRERHRRRHFSAALDSRCPRCSLAAPAFAPAPGLEQREQPPEHHRSHGPEPLRVGVSQDPGAELCSGSGDGGGRARAPQRSGSWRGSSGGVGGEDRRLDDHGRLREGVGRSAGARGNVEGTDGEGRGRGLPRGGGQVFSYGGGRRGRRLCHLGVAAAAAAPAKQAPSVAPSEHEAEQRLGQGLALDVGDDLSSSGGGGRGGDGGVGVGRGRQELPKRVVAGAGDAVI